MSFLPDPFYEFILKNPLYVALPLIVFILWGWLSYKTLYAPMSELTTFENDQDSARKRWINLLKKETFKSFYLSILNKLIRLTSHYNFEDEMDLIKKGKAPPIFTSETLSTFLVIGSLFPASAFFIGYVFFDIGSYLGMEILKPLETPTKFLLIVYITHEIQKTYTITKNPDIKNNTKADKIFYLTSTSSLLMLLFSFIRNISPDYLVGYIFVFIFLTVTINFIAQLLAGEHPESLLLLLAYPLLIFLINILSEKIIPYIENPYLIIVTLLTIGIGLFYLFNRYFPTIFDYVRNKYIDYQPIRLTLIYISLIISISITIIILFKDSELYDLYFSIITYTLIPLTLSIFGWISFSLTKFFITKIYISKSFKLSIILYGILDTILMLVLLLLSLTFIVKNINLINELVSHDVVDLHALTEGMKTNSSDSDYLLFFIMIFPIFIPTLIHIFFISASLVLWLPESFRSWVCENFYVDRHARLAMSIYITIAPFLAISGPILFFYLLINTLNLDYFEALISDLSFKSHTPN